MKATLALEYIGEAQDAKLALFSRIIDQVEDGLGPAVIGNARPRKPWVAEIVGRSAKFRFERKFLSANWQRKRSNSTCSRGVQLWFILESGRFYEVKSPTSWKKSDKYFCTVSSSGEIRRVEEFEVEQWLKDR